MQGEWRGIPVEGGSAGQFDPNTDWVGRQPACRVPRTSLVDEPARPRVNLYLYFSDGIAARWISIFGADKLIDCHSLSLTCKPRGWFLLCTFAIDKGMCGWINASWSRQFERLFCYHGDDTRINPLRYTFKFQLVTRNMRKAFCRKYMSLSMYFFLLLAKLIYPIN